MDYVDDFDDEGEYIDQGNRIFASGILPPCPSKDICASSTICQGITKLHSSWVQTDSSRRDLKNILIAISSRTTSDPSWEASAW
jgi:hypothetical protein